ncbi:protein Skeletor, isoforms B/C-like [Dysidea avara]|uniref:protein Skeletor, isoforms B/C-like n=1 Tax=Dysidea avara TaxID=196820 RepID=UPI003331E961
MMRLAQLALVLLFVISINSGTEGAAEIGRLPTLQHGVRGTLFALDETTFFIRNFEYDGQGPTVYVYIFRRGVTVSRFQNGGGIKINWRDQSSNGRINVRYTGSNITVSLRDQRGGDTGLTMDDIGTFTIWCERFQVFFTRINIPQGLVFTTPVPLQYCAQLTTNFQVSWTVDADSDIGTFELCSCIDSDQYMSFGISGDDTRTNMVGADVVVAWVGQDGVANAVDYYLTSRQQCRGGSGVCPDDMITSNGGGSQDIVNITGEVMNRQTCVQYSRRLTTDDSRYDRPILANQSQFIVWAYGPRANEEGLGDLALFHTEYPRNGANYQLNFNTTPPGNLACVGTPVCEVEEICGWTGQRITAMEPTTFRVRIGPSGGLRGYEYITGQSGWGIALFVDGMLAPVLRVRRNVTYTFIVEAGDDVNDGPNYHPFYITNSIDGGILLDTPEQRTMKNEVVYAGFDVDTNTPLAAGRHCQHVETSSSGNVATSCSSSLEDYLNTLTVSCEGDESEAAILTWTPDDNTPDLVYYQCANHFHLGWSIEVMNGTDSGKGNTTDPGMGNTTDPGMGNNTDRNTTMTGGSLVMSSQMMGVWLLLTITILSLFAVIHL